MKEERFSMWEGKEHWFKYEKTSGLRDSPEAKLLGLTATKIALRSLKYHLEDEMGVEITDELFIDIFRKVCNFNPKPAFGGLAGLEFVEPLKHILVRHGYESRHVNDIWRVFRVNLPSRRYYKKILLHIPHSSITFPEESGYSFNDLDDKERLLIDFYTDELFVSNKVASIVFPYCRLYCDVERLVNDPLEKDGLGIRYSWGLAEHDERHTLFYFSTKQDAYNLYINFHADVSKKLVAMDGSTLLIDCHSFSSLPNRLNSNPPDIDICIGFNEDETCPDKVVIGNIVHHFKTLGYKVGINKPFSNSKTFNVPVEYHTVMIEVNKRLYMDEQTLEKSDSFYKLKHDIQSLYDVLLRK